MEHNSAGAGGGGEQQHFVEATTLASLASTLQEMLMNGNLSSSISEEDELKLLNFPSKREDLSTAIPLTVIFALLLVTGCIGNMCTAIVIARPKNKYMHTATNYYLFSLAMSDFLFLILGLPQEMYTLWQRYPYAFGEPFCIMRGYLSEASTYASILTISAFTIERYVAICHPLWAHTMSQLPRAITSIVIIWILAALCAIPPAAELGIVTQKGPLTNRTLEESAQCAMKRTIYENMFVVSAIVFFIVPMIIVTVLYILIALELRRSSKMNSAMSKQQNSSHHLTSSQHSTNSTTQAAAAANHHYLHCNHHHHYHHHHHHHHLHHFPAAAAATLAGGGGHCCADLGALVPSNGTAHSTGRRESRSAQQITCTISPSSSLGAFSQTQHLQQLRPASSSGNNNSSSSNNNNNNNNNNCSSTTAIQQTTTSADPQEAAAGPQEATTEMSLMANIMSQRPSSAIGTERPPPPPLTSGCRCCCCIHHGLNCGKQAQQQQRAGNQLAAYTSASETPPPAKRTLSSFWPLFWPSGWQVSLAAAAGHPPDTWASHQNLHHHHPQNDRCAGCCADMRPSSQQQQQQQLGKRLTKSNQCPQTSDSLAAAVDDPALGGGRGGNGHHSPLSYHESLIQRQAGQEARRLGLGVVTHSTGAQQQQLQLQHNNKLRPFSAAALTHQTSLTHSPYQSNSVRSLNQLGHNHSLHHRPHHHHYHNQHYHSSGVVGGGHHAHNTSSHRRSTAASSKKSVIRMLVAVVVSFFICWVPFHAQRLLASYLVKSENQNQLLLDIYSKLTYISGVMYYLSSTINPLLYQLMSAKFRLAFKETFNCSLFKCALIVGRRRSSGSPTNSLKENANSTPHLTRGGAHFHPNHNYNNYHHHQLQHADSKTNNSQLGPPSATGELTSGLYEPSCTCEADQPTNDHQPLPPPPRQQQQQPTRQHYHWGVPPLLSPPPNVLARLRGRLNSSLVNLFRFAGIEAAASGGPHCCGACCLSCCCQLCYADHQLASAHHGDGCTSATTGPQSSLSAAAGGARGAIKQSASCALTPLLGARHDSADGLIGGANSTTPTTATTPTIGQTAAQRQQNSHHHQASAPSPTLAAYSMLKFVRSPTPVCSAAGHQSLTRLSSREEDPEALSGGGCSPGQQRQQQLGSDHMGSLIQPAHANDDHDHGKQDEDNLDDDDALSEPDQLEHLLMRHSYATTSGESGQSSSSSPDQQMMMMMQLARAGSSRQPRERAATKAALLAAARGASAGTRPPRVQQVGSSSSSSGGGGGESRAELGPRSQTMKTANGSLALSNGRAPREGGGSVGRTNSATSNGTRRRRASFQQMHNSTTSSNTTSGHSRQDSNGNNLSLAMFHHNKAEATLATRQNSGGADDTRQRRRSSSSSNRHFSSSLSSSDRQLDKKLSLSTTTSAIDADCASFTTTGSNPALLASSAAEGGYLSRKRSSSGIDEEPATVINAQDCSFDLQPPPPTMRTQVGRQRHSEQYDCGKAPLPPTTRTNNEDANNEELRVPLLLADGQTEQLLGRNLDTF